MQEVFTQFHPTLIKDLEMPTSLLELISSTGLLICGEMHGVRENADIAYTLAEQLKVPNFLLERAQEETQTFIQSLNDGEPDWSALDPGVFTASVLSVEMVKALCSLLQSGAIKNVIAVDPEGDDNFDRELAENIQGLKIDGVSLCVLGNWHTRVTAAEGAELSALQWLRKQKPTIPCLHYIYQAGSYFNQATGLGSFDKTLGELSEYSVRQVSNIDYELIIPVAHATQYRG